ncbi:MAG: hypothetical protein WHV67_06425, partial [Thermoanaerobaculia bacterium]
MKLTLKREYLLIIILLYTIFLLLQLKPKKNDWEKKNIPVPEKEREEITRVTKDFSFTETRNEKILFQLYAKEVLAQKETLLFLKDVIMTFFIKEGKLTINCQEAKFDVEKKDAEITGNVMAEFPSGLKIWTENISYHHSKGIMEGLLTLNIQFENYSGKCNEVQIDIFSENFFLKELHIQSREVYIYLPSAKGNFKNLSFFSKERAFFIYKENILTMESFNINNQEEKIFIKGECFWGSFKREKNYVFYSDLFEGEFEKEGLKPIFFKFDKGTKLYSMEGNLSINSENCLIYFEEGNPSILSFNNSIELERENDRIYCDVINAYFKEKDLDLVFFGDYVILCVQGWYITCDSMNYLKKTETLLLKGRTSSSKGYIKAKSDWMKIEEKGEKIIFGGGVEMEDLSRGIKIKSKECTYEDKQKKAAFREKVIAWTEDYTLKGQRMELFEARIVAEGKAEITNLKENLNLKADKIFINQKEERVEALGSVFLQSDKYFIEGYFLQIFRKDSKFERFLFSDLINFYTEDKKQKGKGEILDLYPDKNLIILEGCPALLEDEVQGKIEANQIIILKETSEIFIVDPKKGKVT